jgi:hypothetical protein
MWRVERRRGRLAQVGGGVGRSAVATLRSLVSAERNLQVGLLTYTTLVTISRRSRCP